jgi:translation initiation factor IF-3
LPDALSLARELELDLVEVAPLANPPVCRIMDYGKFRYEESQKAKESRKKSVSTSIKEMKYRPKIGAGDFDTKTRKVAEFLGEGHKVKITIMFRGREMQHPELGMKILIMVLAPDRKKMAPKAPHQPNPSSLPPVAVAAGEIPTEVPAVVAEEVLPVTPTEPTPAA